MKATLSNYRQSPRKVRLAVDLIRGKRVPQAMLILKTLNKRAAIPLQKLLRSAVANAKNNNATTEENLFIDRIEVGKGSTLKRFRPVAFGRAHPIHKHMSHITLFLGEMTANKKPKTSKTNKNLKATS